MVDVGRGDWPEVVFRSTFIVAPASSNIGPATISSNAIILQVLESRACDGRHVRHHVASPAFESQPPPSGGSATSLGDSDVRDRWPDGVSSDVLIQRMTIMSMPVIIRPMLILRRWSNSS